MIVVSSIAVTRCTVPGRKRNAAPAATTSSFSTFSPTPPSSTAARPAWTSHDSSLLPPLPPHPAGRDARRAGRAEPRLVLLAVELQRQRLAGADEEDLAAVGVREGPDELPAPRLLDAARVDRPRVEGVDVR